MEDFNHFIRDMLRNSIVTACDLECSAVWL